MKDFPNILGNDALRSRLAADIRGGTLSHAYIIEAPDGCGKHTLALEIAAALACERRSESNVSLPCCACPACRKILAGKSPDVSVISRDDGKAQIGVDKIRALREDIRFLPNDLDQKIYIIENAHTMNIQAQNAFLLTLEEPPKYVLFLLLCESAAPLLETIRSRAPLLRMSTLPDSTVREYLLRTDASASALSKEAPDEFDAVIKIAGGSPGKAKELLDAKKREPLLAARRLATDFLNLAADGNKGKSSILLLGRFSQKRTELTSQLSEAENAVRDLILIKKCDSAPLLFFSRDDEAAELAFRFKSSALININRAILSAKERLARNANIRLTLYALAIDCGLL